MRQKSARRCSMAESVQSEQIQPARASRNGLMVGGWPGLLLGIYLPLLAAAYLLGHRFVFDVLLVPLALALPCMLIWTFLLNPLQLQRRGHRLQWTFKSALLWFGGFGLLMLPAVWLCWHGALLPVQNWLF